MLGPIPCTWLSEPPSVDKKRCWLVLRWRFSQHVSRRAAPPPGDANSYNVGSGRIDVHITPQLGTTLPVFPHASVGCPFQIPENIPTSRHHVSRRSGGVLVRDVTPEDGRRRGPAAHPAFPVFPLIPVR